MLILFVRFDTFLKLNTIDTFLKLNTINLTNKE